MSGRLAWILKVGGGNVSTQNLDYFFDVVFEVREVGIYLDQGLKFPLLCSRAGRDLNLVGVVPHVDGFCFGGPVHGGSKKCLRTFRCDVAVVVLHPMFVLAASRPPAFR